MMDLIIKNGSIVDGSGRKRFSGDIGITGERIELVESSIDLPSRKTIDADKFVVAPGFIDVHSHSDGVLLSDSKDESRVRQGISTECIGNCGVSLAPTDREYSDVLQKYVCAFFGCPFTFDWESMGQYLDRIKNPPQNVAALVGHGTIRISVMGMENRKPNRYELERMKDLVSEAIDQGAIGLSSGLIYPPGIFADTEELIELCKRVAQKGRIYATHVRGESNTLLDAVREAIEIGKKSGVSVLISHHKAGGKKNWGKVNETLELVEKARDQGIDLHLDQYPYTAGSTLMAAILPPWMQELGNEKMVEELKKPQIRSRIKKDFEEGIKGWENFVEFAGWGGIVLAFCRGNKELEGKSILEVAAGRKEDPAETALDILVEETGEVIMVVHAMSEDDVRTVMNHPLVMVGTDGIPTSGRPHPRLFSTYPRILGKYVREERILSLEEAVRKMTNLPAQKMQLKDRGLIAKGMIADIIIFDPDVIMEKSTYLNPHQYPEGIEYLVINGSMVIEKGRIIDRQRGRILRAGFH